MARGVACSSRSAAVFAVARIARLAAMPMSPLRRQREIAGELKLLLQLLVMAI